MSDSIIIDNWIFAMFNFIINKFKTDDNSN